MEVSDHSFKPTCAWKRRGLDLNIMEINNAAISKRPKISVSAFADTLVEGDRYGICAKKGKFRKTMEDSFQVALDLPNTSSKHAFAIFDGHSGSEASVFASKNLIKNIKKTDKKGLIEAFHLTDSLLSAESIKKGGTTAALAIIDNCSILTANIGDTKIILVKEQSYEILSYDHVASDAKERSRIERAGGYVIAHRNIQRVCGQLAITRSIGDFKYKDYVIPTPFCQTKSIEEDDIVLIIASDGLFETLAIDQVCKIAREKQQHKSAYIAESLVQEAIETGSKDNVTVLVINIREISMDLSRECKVDDLE